MKRKIYEKLLVWKRKSAGKTALLIDGARRVGKSAKSYTFKSLRKFIGKHADFVSTPHILHVKDVRVDDESVVRLPLYMAPLLIESSL